MARLIMFGVFKKIFSRQGHQPVAATPVAEQPARAPAPSPSPKTAAPAAPAPARTATPAGDMIELPLNDIIAQLPNDVAALVLKSPGGTFSFFASDATKQLRSGMVRIPFSQLRQGAPAGTFAPDGSKDNSLIDLPLAAILNA